jgi:hypothetical protein
MVKFSDFKHITKADIHHIIDLAKKAKNSREISTGNKSNLSNKRATSEEQVLLDALKGMTSQKQIELCAFMLLGRTAKEEDNEPVFYKDIIDEAERVGKIGIVDYLFEKPLDDYLEEGLKKV